MNETPLTPEEVRNAALTEMHDLVEKLPMKQLQELRDHVVALHAQVASSPEIQDAESRFKTIAKHLWTSIMTGEHAVVTDVHNFLLSRGRIIPFPVGGAPAPTVGATDSEATTPAPTV